MYVRRSLMGGIRNFYTRTQVDSGRTGTGSFPGVGVGWGGFRREERWRVGRRGREAGGCRLQLFHLINQMIPFKSFFCRPLPSSPSPLSSTGRKCPPPPRVGYGTIPAGPDGIAYPLLPRASFFSLLLAPFNSSAPPLFPRNLDPSDAVLLLLNGRARPCHRTSLVPFRSHLLSSNAAPLNLLLPFSHRSRPPFRRRLSIWGRLRISFTPCPAPPREALIDATER